ncbi:MAG: translation elongation factor Ts [Flavobacteriaceae bacterium]|nr:translation elongation factor Ts [Flavobacteriaceae bacterium]
MTAISASMVKELREMTGAAMMDCKKALTECAGSMEDAKEFLRKKGQTIANKKSSRETKEGAICIKNEGQKAALVKVACETDFVAINDDFLGFINKIAAQSIEVEGKDLMNQTTSGGAIKEQFIEAISKLGENIVFVDGEYWNADKNSAIGSYTHSNGKIGVMVEIGADELKQKDQVQNLARDLAMHIAASQVEAIATSDLDPAVIDKERTFLIQQAQDSGKPQNIIEKMVEGRLKKFQKEICLLEQNFVKNPEKSINQVVNDLGKEIGSSLQVKRYYKSTF